MSVDQETAYPHSPGICRPGPAHALRRRLEPPPLTREMIQRDVQAAFAELEPQQLAIPRRMTPAERFESGLRSEWIPAECGHCGDS